MSTRSAEDRNESFLPLIETMTAVFAGTVYGLGWLFSAGFASRFGIYPEEIGLTFPFIAVRTALLVLLFVAIAAPTIYIVWNSQAAQRFWTRGAEFESTFFNGAFLALQLAMIGIFGVLFITWSPWKYTFPWDLICITASCLAFLAFLATECIGIAKARFGSSLRDDDDVSSWHRRRRPLTLLFILLIGAFLCIATWFSGGFVASQVKDGHSIDLGAVHVFAVTVEVPSASAGNLLEGEAFPACFMYLGSSDGIAVLYDTSGNRIVRVAVENTTSLQNPKQRQCQKQTKPSLDTPKSKSGRS